MTAKEIYDLIRNKPYKDGEQMIKDYAKQEIIKRDEQWRQITYSLNEIVELNPKLPEPKFE